MLPVRAAQLSDRTLRNLLVRHELHVVEAHTAASAALICMFVVRGYWSNDDHGYTVSLILQEYSRVHEIALFGEAGCKYARILSNQRAHQAQIRKDKPLKHKQKPGNSWWDLKLLQNNPKSRENDSLSIVPRTRDQRLSISDQSSTYQCLRAFLFR
jgi:hypothetical protein